MALDFNGQPYYDDFDETKKFYRILFKPGYAVQARELTQLQTQLQDQIKKFGNSIFKDGTVVLGGEKFYETDLVAVKIQTTMLNGLVTALEGKTVVGATSAVKGFVRKVVIGTTDHTLLIKVTSGTAFTLGEVLNVNGIATATILGAAAFSNSLLFSVKQGVFYVNGHFVYNTAQSIVVDPSSNTSSWSLGFVVKESTISADSDETLLDNAQGTYNYAAPGADRYSIDLVLTAKLLTAEIDNFIELARVENGQYIIKEDTTIYSELGKEFARRTYDESGDYTVTNFKLTFRDHIGGDTTKLTAALDPGKAYIRGYEFETKNQSYVDIDRALTTDTASNVESYTTFGNYVFVNSVNASFVTNDSAGGTTSYSTVELHNAARASVTSSATKIGTARVRYFKWYSGTPGSAIYKAYLFNISIDAGKFFKDTKSIILTVAATSLGANIDALSFDAGTGATFLTGSDRPGLVFPLNNSFIKTASGVGYRTQRTYKAQTFTNGDLVLTAGSNELFSGTPGALDDESIKTYYHVINDTTGAVIDFTGANGDVTLNAGRTTLTFTSALATFTGTVIATLDVDLQAPRTKALSGYTYKVISSPNTTVGGKDSLGYADGYDLLAVYNTSTTNPTGLISVDSVTGAVTWGTVSSHADVTRDYSFDDGQRDEYYDHSNIVLTGTAPGASTYLVAVFRYFSHSGSVGYLSVDSYPSGGTVPYEDIPKFTSPTSGTTYELRDCFDFRPRRVDNATTLNYGQIPDPASAVTSDYQYYLSRKDRIIATAGKSFEVKKGVPALSPLAPDNSSDGMSLYILTIPPYTADLNEIEVQYIDNRRYTMRDIGKIEKRVVNLEYYTQLSLLEKQAQDESIPDSSSIEKFKNGILVDAFAGHTVGDATNPDYRCAIDLQRRELRSFAETYHVDADFSTGTNVTRKGDLVTLNYTEASFAEQPFATKAININPFNVVSFVGTINLEPSQDIWIDTITLPPLNVTQDVNITVNAIKPILPRPRLGWFWNQPWGWNDTWGFGGAVGGFGWSGWGWGLWNGWNSNFWGGWNGNWGGVGQTWRNGRRIMQNELVTTTNITTDTDSLGASVVDLQFLPYIRQRTIIGITTGLKPVTRHYPFIDTTAASAYARPLTKVVITGMTGTLFSDATGAYEKLTFSAGGTGYVAKVGPLVGTTRNVWIFNVTGTIAGSTSVTGEHTNSATVSSITTYALNDAIYTDDSGIVAFELQLPGGTFRTGERKVRLIDNSTNDESTTQSSGETTYFALGQLKSEQETLLTTRTITNTQSIQARQIGWADPVAESFLVDSNVYPNGLHLSSVEVYFRTKSSSVPVTLELRKMVNGYPESVSTIAFGSTALFPENISISEDAMTSTKFTFPSTVYLPAGEYCFVLMANTNEYEVWVAEMGKNLLGSNVRMTQQPYAGSLFKSQNSTTWSAIQEEDLKFKLNRCEFAASGTATFVVDDPYSYSTTGNITSGSPTITNVPAAAFYNLGTGMLVSGTGIPSGTTITAATFTGGTTGTLTLSANATATTTSLAITLYGTYDYSLINVNGSIISPALTTVSLGVKGLTKGTSVMDASFTNIVNKSDYEFAVVKNVIPSALNSGASSLQIQATLASTNTAVSPAIDVGRLGATLVKSVINNDFTNENSKSGGNARSRYITKAITLADGFDASNLVVTFDAYKPFGTDLKVYYKTLPIGKTTPIDDESWVLMNPEHTVENSVNDLDYKEHRFFPVGAFDTYGVPVNNPISPRFNTYAIKIVMLSSNEAYAPRIRDFRTIALYN